MVDRPLSGGPGRSGSAPPIAFRRPSAADHPSIVGRVDAWWGRRVRATLPRLWFEHFSGTSWLAEEPDSRLAGFVVAFVSPDDPTTGRIHMIGTDPNRRRQGIGRALLERVAVDLAGRGVRRLVAATWPGDRIPIDFLRAVGFGVDDGPGTRPIYGTPAWADHDGPDEDRAVFVREL